MSNRGCSLHLAENRVANLWQVPANPQKSAIFKRTENPCVGGSNPPRGTILKQWLSRTLPKITAKSARFATNLAPRANPQKSAVSFFGQFRAVANLWQKRLRSGSRDRGESDQRGEHPGSVSDRNLAAEIPASRIAATRERSGRVAYGRGMFRCACARRTLISVRIFSSEARA